MSNNFYTKRLLELCKEPRPSGSSRIKSIEKYLIYDMKTFGFEPKSYKYPFVGWELIKEPKVKFLKPSTVNVPTIPVIWSGSTEGENLVGKIINFFSSVKTFEAYDWQCYTIVDSEDKLIGYLITRPDMVWAQPLDNWDNHVPYIIVDTNACKLINKWIVDNEDIEIEFSVNSRNVPDLYISNIVSAPKNKRRIILCSHYDSMFNTVGAHDNASGVVALLNLANKLNNVPTLRDDIEIIFFDAEEWNKYGSYCYVSDLTNKNELNCIELVINLDSVGVGDYVYLLTSPCLESTTKDIISKIDISKQINITVSSKKEFPQFDSWPFMRKGIPVIQVGTRGTPSFKYFHHPKDDLNNIDCCLIDTVVNLLYDFIVFFHENYFNRRSTL